MAKDEIKLNSYAKINLCLDVVGKREDGYHELVGIMQTLSLHDKIHIKKVYKDNYLKLSSNLRYLPVDERNIVYQAAKMLIDKYKIPGGVFIDIKKNIPVSSGLGGGSSNCAVTIVGMKKLFSLSINDDESLSLGRKLGADVPFFFKGGTSLAEGIGDLLTPIPVIPTSWFVLVRPPIIISSAKIFGKFNIKNKKQSFDVQKMISCLESSDLQGICDNFYNALEDVTIAEFPVIEKIKRALCKNHALGSLMSGSGPTVFGCFADEITAREAASSIRREFGYKDIFVTKSL